MYSLVPRPYPSFFNARKKKREGLVDFSDAMDVVYGDAQWNAQLLPGPRATQR